MCEDVGSAAATLCAAVLYSLVTDQSIPSEAAADTASAPSYSCGGYAVAAPSVEAAGSAHGYY